MEESIAHESYQSTEIPGRTLSQGAHWYSGVELIEQTTVPDSLQTRELQQGDLPSVGTLLVEAPDDGTIYSFPDVRKYPERMYSYHTNWLRSCLLKTDMLTRVAVIPRTGDGKAQVVGFSQWIRRVRDARHPEKFVKKQWRTPTVFDSILTLS